MFYAKNEVGEYVFASENVLNLPLYCPDCQEQVKMRKSKNGRYFFVHRKRCSKSGGESDFHQYWKMYIAKELGSYGARQEVSVSANRRADILVGKTVIEIQFSIICQSVLEERICDYIDLGLKQYWIFKLPRNKGKTLVLTSLAKYIWKHTKIPLLYIDVQRGCLMHVIGVQFISQTRVLYESRSIPWTEIINLERLPENKCVLSILQKRWLIERCKLIPTFQYYQQQNRTRTAKELYYLIGHGYKIEQLGVAYTANCLFTVSPFIWQIRLLYLYLIKCYSVEACCLEMEKLMISGRVENTKVIVEQLLERFLSELVDS
ncbi:MAG: competence protein CoiA family protein [Culicoidibacterales bacterium]